MSISLLIRKKFGEYLSFREKSIPVSNKVLRLINVSKGIELGRKGSCTPDKCKTLNGDIGAACCKLGYRCPALTKQCKCSVYNIRPVNCSTFPRSRDDLKLVSNCGFYWE
jgi:Fe-S-cluster containining protein